MRRLLALKRSVEQAPRQIWRWSKNRHSPHFARFLLRGGVQLDCTRDGTSVHSDTVHTCTYRDTAGTGTLIRACPYQDGHGCIDGPSADDDARTCRACAPSMRTDQDSSSPSGVQMVIRTFILRTDQTLLHVFFRGCPAAPRMPIRYFLPGLRGFVGWQGAPDWCRRCEHRITMVADGGYPPGSRCPTRLIGCKSCRPVRARSHLEVGVRRICQRV